MDTALLGSIIPTLQRVIWTLLAGAPAAAAQNGQATQLWGVASTTLPVPGALVTGSPAAFWNPAQIFANRRVLGGLDVIQAPSEVGASGFLAAVHVGILSVGHVGLVYGRMQVTDLVRTTTSPEPQPGSVPYYTHAIALTWTRSLGSTTVGATAGFHDIHVDAYRSGRWSFDVGARHQMGEALRIGLATHFLSPDGSTAGRQVYGGLGYRVWHIARERGGGEEERGDGAQLELRYGVALTRGTGTDHFIGAGFDWGEVLGVDLMIARESGYTTTGWRPVGGVRLGVGTYRLTVARDGGMRGVGSAFRVGIEVGRRHD